jgi:hypothetical protein
MTAKALVSQAVSAISWRDTLVLGLVGREGHRGAAGGRAHRPASEHHWPTADKYEPLVAGQRIRNPSAADPDLARVVTAWPDLAPHIKAAVLALIGTAR